LSKIITLRLIMPNITFKTLGHHNNVFYKLLLRFEKPCLKTSLKTLDTL